MSRPLAEPGAGVFREWDLRPRNSLLEWQAPEDPGEETLDVLQRIDIEAISFRRGLSWRDYLLYTGVYSLRSKRPI